MTVHEARTELEVSAYYKVLHAYYRTKLHRYLPGEDFFQRLLHTPRAHILVAYYKGRVVGGASVMESKGDGYLWYMAAQGKRYPTARPLTATVWHALEYCHAQKLRHVSFST